MKLRITPAMILGGYLVFAVGAAAYAVSLCWSPGWSAAEVKEFVDRELPMPYQIQRIDEPGPEFLMWPSGIDAVVRISGDPTKVLSEFEAALRSREAPVRRSAKSVGYQVGDCSVTLTHISEDSYRYEETFAL